MIYDIYLCNLENNFTKFNRLV